MQPMIRAGSQRFPGVQPGFTLIETMVALAILATILAVGIPTMSNWTYANQVAGAAQFYSEGMVMARNQALTNNSASRLVLIENKVNKQMDWRVDVCFPTTDKPCTEESTNWSTTAASAADDPKGTAGFKSVLRPSSSLPSGSVLQVKVGPDNADSVYFTPLGWVDTALPGTLRRIDLEPKGSHAGKTPKQAVVLTLAGIATRCKPDVDENDTQRCSP